MKDFLAEYCHINDDKINRDVFERNFDKPLVDYIVDTCKNLEVLPAIKLLSWEYITDQTKIRNTLNKRNAKDPKIKNNKSLERLAQPNRTLYDLLVLNFSVKAKGREALVTRKVRILKQVRGGFYKRNGKKVMLLNQVVDNSTFVKGHVLNFKTKLYPIKISTVTNKMKILDGETLTYPCFRLELLTKTVNPLIYYMAQYGVADTLAMFNLNGAMSIVDAPLDERYYLYVKVNDGVYLEINERLFANESIATFASTLHDLLKHDKTVSFKEVYSSEYWQHRLSAIFTKKSSVDKAMRVLISFNKIVDPSARKQLALKGHHKKNTFTIIRWMLMNYGELLKKDSNDLKNKRVRSNEVLAFEFDKRLSYNVYSLLNTDDPPFEKYLTLLNSISEDTMLRGAGGASKGSKSSMFRYERYNDFDAIELSRYTLKGPTGLTGGRYSTSMRHRDIYPSHFGRYDLNVCSSSDPRLTGYLCSNVKLDPSGYFDGSDSEPDDYDENVEEMIVSMSEPGYIESRESYVKMRLSVDEDGYIQMSRKLTPVEMTAEFNRDPTAYGLYECGDVLKLIPRTKVDPKGYIVLTKKKVDRKDAKVVIDKDGYQVLTRIITKIDRQRLFE